MRKIHVFENISLDGYFTDEKSDMSWAHKRDEEWNAFASGNASGEAELLFGRVTYEMMAAFWPTAEAAKLLPDVAAGMNRMRKLVVSRTLEAVTWQNTTLLKGDLVSEAMRLKKQLGPDLPDTRQRQHCLAAHRRRAHRRVSDRGDSDCARPRPHAVRDREEQAAARTDLDPALQERQRRADVRETVVTALGFRLQALAKPWDPVFEALT